MTGAPQGAATRPEAAPMPRAPSTRPPVFIPAARAMSACGTGTGMTSNIMSAKISSRLAIPNSIQLLVLMLPNISPLNPAMRPSMA